MPSITHKRGTRAQIDAAATAGALKAGEVYLITDEGRLTIGTAPNAHQAAAKQGEGGSGGGGGAGALSGSLTLTLPGGRGALEHRETLAALGVTPSNRVFLGLATANDAQENDPEFIDLLSLSATPLTGELAIIATFAAPMSGPVLINWSAL